MATIGYRRTASPLDLTAEAGATDRGTWVEKRRALLGWLTEARGHRLVPLGPWSKRLGKLGQPAPQLELAAECDVLMLEFGVMNRLWRADHLDETAALIDGFRGPVIWLSDDPEIKPPWERYKSSGIFMDRPEWGRWVAWVNSSAPGPWAPMPPAAFGQFFDFPFGALLPWRQPREAAMEKLIYAGRPTGGRDQLLRFVALHQLARNRLELRGRAADWTGLAPLELDGPAFPQRDRAEELSKRRAALALGDRQHMALKWRTGRSSHALHAGTPVLAPANHGRLAGLAGPYRVAREAWELFDSWADPACRFEAWEAQARGERALMEICEKTAAACGI